VNFKQTEAYLLSLGNEVSAMKLGLSNIRGVLAALGDPQKQYLKVQVAGTNGKGSVCAFLNAICVTAGIKTGMFTSPHLISMTERVKIDGVDIGEKEFAAFATRVREVSESLFASDEIENIPTYFEQVTAIALLAFASANVELAILETGLGGRLDATTAANAEIAAITRIDLDHQQYLGETIEEIAAEKAAIIGPHTKRVVMGEQVPQAEKVICERAWSFGLGPMSALKIQSIKNGPKVSLYPFGEIELGLPGKHQIENAKVAILLTEDLMELFAFEVKFEDVIHGLESARHPGRLEWIGRYLLDGAHNVGGARALRNYLDEFVDWPITMIFGAMSDKDVGEITSILFPKANRLILTMPDNSRAMKPEGLLHFVPDGFDRDRVFVTPNTAAAIEQAREFSDMQDVVLVTGSLYLVGEMRRMLTTDPPEKLKTNN
jgi:dihydrofolate synthase/folylpolyglutamate synthase